MLLSLYILREGTNDKCCFLIEGTADDDDQFSYVCTKSTCLSEYRKRKKAIKTQAKRPAAKKAPKPAKGYVYVEETAGSEEDSDNSA
jgi:hypothetical protein